MEIPLPTDSLPRQSWRLLGLAAVLLLVITVTAIGFISAGFFDPQTVGGPTAVISLHQQTVPAQSQSIDWLAADLLTADDFSLRLTAAHESGDLDVGYGLALGSDDDALVVALSPLGYAAVLQFESLLSQTGSDLEELDGMIGNGPVVDAVEQPGTPLFAWQPWPHVHSGQETNEIWLDKRGESITVRINRELLWSGSVTVSASQVGLWTTSFNQEATIDFESLVLFSETAQPFTQPHQ